MSFRPAVISAICLAAVFSAVDGFAQAPKAAASKPVGADSTGVPSTLEIKQNALDRQRRIIESGIAQAQRCISEARNSTTLRDPQGNVNQVPLTDIINCSRTLSRLTAQLEALARQEKLLQQDARFQAISAQRRLQQKKVQEIFRATR